jgi:hypothetical protein
VNLNCIYSINWQEADQPLGYGDNLLQMAFNSAMEGLQVPPDSNWEDKKPIELPSKIKSNYYKIKIPIK